jgi:hypothetical protein
MLNNPVATVSEMLQRDLELHNGPTINKIKQRLQMSMTLDPSSGSLMVHNVSSLCIASADHMINVDYADVLRWGISQSVLTRRGRYRRHGKSDFSVVSGSFADKNLHPIEIIDSGGADGLGGSTGEIILSLPPPRGI